MSEHSPCRTFAAQIAPALLGELPEAELAAVRAHLDTCPACAAEADRYRETLNRLDTLRDLPPPRSFQISPRLSATGPGRRFRPPAWAWAAGLAALVLLGGLASGRLWVRVDHGTWMAGFGTPPALTPTPDLERELVHFRQYLLAELDARRQEDRARWQKDVRTELAGFGQTLSREQQRQLDTRLANLESRFGQSLQTVQADLRGNTQIQLAGLYGLLRDERRGEMRLLTERIGLLASRSEKRASQTDAILATLLDVSEQQLRP